MIMKRKYERDGVDPDKLIVTLTLDGEVRVQTFTGASAVALLDAIDTAGLLGVEL